MTVSREEASRRLRPLGSGKSTLIKCVNGLGALHSPASIKRGGHRGGRQGPPICRVCVRVSAWCFSILSFIRICRFSTMSPWRKFMCWDARGRKPTIAAGSFSSASGWKKKALRCRSTCPAVAAAASRDCAGAGARPAGDAVRRADLGAGSGNDPRGSSGHGPKLASEGMTMVVVIARDGLCPPRGR